MHIWLHKIEVLVDRLIPPVLVALLIVIVSEIFFSYSFEWYENYADWFEGLIVLLFATDLGFKYYRVRKLPTFLKKYWLQIIATIPFFMVFRLLEFLKLSELFGRGQGLVHEGIAAVRVESEVSVLLKEAAKVGEASRSAKLLKTFKAISRMPHMVNAIHFFEKPTGQHHWHEKIKQSN